MLTERSDRRLGTSATRVKGPRYPGANLYSVDDRQYVDGDLELNFSALGLDNIFYLAHLYAKTEVPFSRYFL